MESASSSSSRKLPQVDDKGVETSARGGATGLYRAPTWARNINFDSNFDLNTSPSANIDGYSSPSDGTTGLALGGSPRLNDQQSPVLNGNWSQPAHQDALHSRSGSGGGGVLPYTSSPHTRQGSNPPGTPMKNSPTLTLSDKSTPKAAQKSVMSAMLPSHQRVASASSGTGSMDWSRPPVMAKPHSSADLYAAPAESRPGTSMSTLSASMEDGKDDRRDSEASSAAAKRASVLSFQTALSGVGGYGSTEELTTTGNRYNQNQSIGSSDFEVLDDTLPRKPWLDHKPVTNPSGASSFSSSPDDRILPGGWSNNKPWNSGFEDATTSTRSSPAMVQKAIRSPSQSPQLRLAPLEEPSSTTFATHSRSSSGGSPLMNSALLTQSPTIYQEQKPFRPQSMLRNETTEDLQVNSSQGNPLSPISGHSTMHGVQPKEASATPIPTTGAALPDVASSEMISGRDRSSTVTNDSNRKRQPDQASEQEIASATEPNEEKEEEAAAEPPVPPEKHSPPSVPSKNEMGLSSPPLSDNVIPPPLPSEVAGEMSGLQPQMPADRLPISDFRRKPLAKVSIDETPDKPVNSTTQRSGQRSPVLERDTRLGAMRPSSIPPAQPSPLVRPGVGAHDARNSGMEQIAAPAFAALMKEPSSGAPPRAALAASPAPVPIDRSPSPSIETPPREPSPPPEGEVEARAEWERAQMRQMADRAKKASTSPRKATFRAQLKPLQLVTAEDSKRTGRNSPVRESPTLSKTATMEFDEAHAIPAELDGSKITGTRQVSDGNTGNSTSSPNISPVVGPPKSGGGLSTQQLQRQLARDQRRSVSAVNMAMGQMGVSDIGGAYPVFPSPSTSATNVVGGNRQYPGLMPQRSLVPPFELQNRPDGLPSALVGPDGTRRNPNDPEICLECMMRDEDMIDVHVLGAGLWERESDRGFEEAKRLEAEEDAKKERAKLSDGTTLSNGTHGGTLESVGNGGEGEGTNRENATYNPAPVRLTRIRVKRVAKGEPLTAERLKLHTQMNPPASSHRWRTLQTFLHVQAKYIAMEQKTRGLTAAPAVPPKSGPEYDNRMLRTQSGDSKANQRVRAPSAGLFMVTETPLTSDEKVQKEKDIISAREARRRNNASIPETSTARSMRGVEGVIPEGAELGNRLSGPPLPNDNSSGHHSIPRRSNAGPNVFARAGSAQDLRMIPNATLAKNELQPPLSPIGTLAPPNAPFRGPPTPSTPGSTSRMRTVSSQMSLAGSGSMIDMHVGLEDRKEHRISQAGFMPGTPLHSQSPGALNRAYYGFPGDGEMERQDEWGQGKQYDQSMATSYGDFDESYQTSRASPELERKKKKGGLRGFFSKISGKEGNSNSEMNRGMRQDEDSGESFRRMSMGADAAMDLQPPPSIGGLLSKARRSTSSLLSPSGRQSMDSQMMLGDRSLYNNPLMGSQTSLELGPFGSGPLPPPRKDSKFARAASPRAPSPEKEKSRLRTFSSGNLMSKRKTAMNPPIPSPSNRTSSMMQPIITARTTSNGSNPIQQRQYSQYDSPNNESNVSTQFQQPRTDMSNAPMGGLGQHARVHSNPQDGRYPASPAPSHVMQQFEATEAAYRRQDNQASSMRSSQSPTLQQSNSPSMPRYNSGEGLTPADGEQQSVSGEGSNAPKRPPRSPHRDNRSGPPSEHQYNNVDGVMQSMSNNMSQSPLQIPSQFQKEQYYHSTDQISRGGNSGNVGGMQRIFGQTDYDQYGSGGGGGMSSSSSALMSSAPVPAPSRKSKLLKLPFGKNKRESVATVKSSGSNSNNNGVGQERRGGATPSLKSRSSRGTFDEVIGNGGQGGGNNNGNNGQYTNGSLQPGFESLRGGPTGWNGDRQRMTSSASWDERGLPPRSQSAMGMLDGNAASGAGGSGGMRSFLPRLRVNSRAALREVQED